MVKIPFSFGFFDVRETTYYKKDFSNLMFSEKEMATPSNNEFTVTGGI